MYKVRFPVSKSALTFILGDLVKESKIPYAENLCYFRVAPLSSHGVRTKGETVRVRRHRATTSKMEVNVYVVRQ